MWYVWGEMYTGFWYGNLEVRGHWEDLGIHWRIVLKCTHYLGQQSGENASIILNILFGPLIKHEILLYIFFYPTFLF
jgi:hypothetical protein